MADISAEIAAFKNAVYGEDVRDAMVSLANKLNNELNSGISLLNDAEYMSKGKICSDTLKYAGINLLVGSSFRPGFYAGRITQTDSYMYTKIPIVSGTSYTYRCCRFISSETTVIKSEEGWQDNRSHTFVADYTGYVYVSIHTAISFHKNLSTYKFIFCKTENYTDDMPSAFKIVFEALNLAQDIDSDDNTLAISQYGARNGILKYFNYIADTDQNEVLYGRIIEGKYFWNGYYYNNPIYSVVEFYGKPNTTYKCNRYCRFISLNSNNYAEGIYPDTPFITPDGDELVSVRCSIYADVASSTIVIEQDKSYDDYSSFRFNHNSLAQTLGNSIYAVMSQKAVTDAISEITTDSSNRKHSYKISQSLAASEKITIPSCNVKRNHIFNFECFDSNFTKIRFGHGYDTYYAYWIEVDDTNLVVYSKINTITSQTYPHGITLSDYINVKIEVNDGTAKISIYSNGVEFSQNVGWSGDGPDSVFVENLGSSAINIDFSYGSKDFAKNIWMFGDSYFSYGSNARWPYYLKRDGYIDNVLLNGYPGENSATAISSLTNMLEHYGKPSFIVWCMGMNDGSDSSGSPSATYSTNVEAFRNLCLQYNITPILATTPTCPTVNNEKKNEYVRNSGLRYIDFAKAVGADSSGNWYPNMLSSDNVHPDVAGAIALYYRAVLDVPEITMD